MPKLSIHPDKPCLKLNPTDYKLPTKNGNKRQNTNLAKKHVCVTHHYNTEAFQFGYLNNSTLFLSIKIYKYIKWELFLALQKSPPALLYESTREKINTKCKITFLECQ